MHQREFFEPLRRRRPPERRPWSFRRASADGETSHPSFSACARRQAAEPAVVLSSRDEGLIALPRAGCDAAS